MERSNTKASKVSLWRLYAVSEGETSGKSGEDRGRATPVTMSNTEVKTSTAESTGLVTVWKIRYLPVE